MNLKRLLFCLLIMLTTNIFAQCIIDEQRLDDALIEVIYKRIKVTDTLLVNTDFKADYLTLRAGKNISAFYSARLKTEDSLGSRNLEYVIAQIRDTKTFKEVARLENEVVYKNFPSGKVSVYNRYDMENWKYEELWEKPVWEITDSTAIIGGYECLLAISDYRGRRWFAWFAPEIPVSEGPWKLCGLAGLILEAFDDKNHYRYTVVSLIANPGRPVEYYNYRDRVVTDRITSLKNRRKALQNSIAYQIQSSGAFGIKTRNLDPPKKLLHRNYDFEETDYPHE
ncbi:MAG: GLPGLI family protein [Bacteroidales bacterium]